MVPYCVCDCKYFPHSSYKRKLKASKAFNSAMDLKQQDGPVVPGTNKFSKEGSGDNTFNYDDDDDDDD